MYRGDLLYSEGDLADEIIFVLDGTFYLYKDISDMIILPEKLIEGQTSPVQLISQILAKNMDNPTKTEITTIFRRLRSVPANKVSFTLHLYF